MDLFAALDARDQGTEMVLRNAGPWFDRAMAAVIECIEPGWTGTGEDLRLSVAALVGCPHHHNAWGALILNAQRRGFLTKTGSHQHMSTNKSHGRMTPVLRRTWCS